MILSGYFVVTYLILTNVTPYFEKTTLYKMKIDKHLLIIDKICLYKLISQLVKTYRFTNIPNKKVLY